MTARSNCEYEWGVHVAVFSQAANFTDEQIAATRLEASNAACWNAKESLLIESVDQLCERYIIEGEALVQFQESWTIEQQLEIMALCGNYHLISLVANTSRVGKEPWADSFPT